MGTLFLVLGFGNCWGKFPNNPVFFDRLDLVLQVFVSLKQAHGRQLVLSKVLALGKSDGLLDDVVLVEGLLDDGILWIKTKNTFLHDK